MWNTEHDKQPKLPEELKERPIAEGDLVGNFVRRTDNDFKGVKEQGLIGEDIGEDEEDADENR